jgi:MFS family permease
MKRREETSYRWIILIAMMLGIAGLNYCILLVPAIAVTIIKIFGFSQVQFASIASIAFLAGAILGIPSGTIADRIGVKPVVTCGLLIALIGSIGRMYAGNYSIFLLCSFLIGVGSATIDANAAKYISMWFKPEEMGIAMGLFVGATGVGTSLAFATGNLYPTYSLAFAVGTIWITVAFLFWGIFAKKVEIPDTAKHEPFKKHLGVCMKSRYLWITTLSIFLILGATLVVNNFLTQALILEKSCEPVQAGLITTMLNICLIIGGVMSGIITSKAGRIKPVIIPICIICGLCYYLAWIVPFGTATYIILCIAGLTAGGTIPVSKSIVPMIVKTGDFGIESVGTAGGIHSAAQNLGAFIVPTYIVAAMVGQNFHKSFLLAFVLFVIAGLLNLLIPELGAKNDIHFTTSE